MLLNTVIPVKDILVRKEIAETRFSCDLQKCKGACCTLESEFGAPLLSEEIDEINKILPLVLEYLPDAHKEKIINEGFYDIKDAELMTRSIDDKQCVFVYYEKNIAKCGIERAYLDGKSDFKKPISCHLFPIRISSFGGDMLRYEKFSECTPALTKGETADVTILEFCEEALTRKYGEKWYSELKKSAGI